MTRQRNVKTNLFDILECSKNSLKFIEGMDFDCFEKDIKTSAAVLHELMIIGEAVKRLGTEFTNNNPVLPWKKMAGARDVLIHHYEDADLLTVWEILQNELRKK